MFAGLIYKEGSEEAKKFAAGAVEELVSRDFAVRSLSTQEDLPGAEPCPEQGWSEGLDLAVVVGGDGTLLRAVQLVNTSRVPIIGVKLGGLGFLTEVRPEEFPLVLDDFKAGRLEVTERMMLTGSIEGESGEQGFLALNEISITSSEMPRIIELDTSINGTFVTSFRADGLLVSSPTGSTAYCMAAGGPIVHPEMRSLTITPICPHTLTSRPLVVPDSATIKVTPANDVNPVRVTADSQKAWPLNMGDTLEIKAAQRGLPLVKSPSMDYYEILRTKLRWGEK